MVFSKGFYRVLRGLNQGFGLEVKTMAVREGFESALVVYYRVSLLCCNCNHSGIIRGHCQSQRAQYPLIMI